MAESRYTIPLYNEMPSDEMIDWLHENPNDWSGDDFGIHLNQETDEYVSGGPGETVARDDETMKYWIEDKDGNKKPFSNQETWG